MPRAEESQFGVRVVVRHVARNDVVVAHLRLAVSDGQLHRLARVVLDVQTVGVGRLLEDVGLDGAPARIQ